MSAGQLQFQEQGFEGERTMWKSKQLLLESMGEGATS